MKLEGRLSLDDAVLLVNNLQPRHREGQAQVDLDLSASLCHCHMLPPSQGVLGANVLRHSRGDFRDTIVDPHVVDHSSLSEFSDAATDCPVLVTNFS